MKEILEELNKLTKEQEYFYDNKLSTTIYQSLWNWYFKETKDGFYNRIIV